MARKGYRTRKVSNQRRKNSKRMKGGRSKNKTLLKHSKRMKRGRSKNKTLLKQKHRYSKKRYQRGGMFAGVGKLFGMEPTQTDATDTLTDAVKEAATQGNVEELRRLRVGEAGGGGVGWRVAGGAPA